MDNMNPPGSPSDYPAARPLNDVMFPKELVAQLVAADVVIFLTVDDKGAVQLKPVVPGKEFAPDTNQAHLLMSVITHELPNLMAQAMGDLTDSDRYQALRFFAQLKTLDKDRFEKVNAAMQAYEDKHGTNLNEATDPEQFDAYANFLADVLLTTHPDDESQQKKELIIPGTNIILPMR